LQLVDHTFICRQKIDEEESSAGVQQHNLQWNQKSRIMNHLRRRDAISYRRDRFKITLSQIVANICL
jgi:hypothetical protein